jgi:phospholipid/cholesterol/gamma-HCH transport system substrate-binding protein
MGKQFIERNALVIGAIAAVLIVATLLVALTVTRDELTGGYVVTARFTDANGLREGDVALVAGIPVGEVVRLEIPERQAYVEADIQMDGGVELPASTRATITLRTLVGKRAVDLDTGTDFSGELLADGDVIPLERTSVTIDVPQLGEVADDLLGDIDSEALNLLLTSVADVTRDQRDEVAELIESGGDLTRIVNDQEEQVRALLRNLTRLSATLESRDDELIAVIDDLDVATAQLAARRADLQDLLRETQRSGTLTADFVRDVRADLDAILDELHLDLEAVARHQVDLAEGLAYLPDALIGFGSIALADGQPVEWGHVFVTSLGPAGVDALVGCGGLVDQQLDALIGPDPRPCSQQSGTDTFPEDTPNLEQGGGNPPSLPVPGIPVLVLTADTPAVRREPQRLPVDIGPRSLLEVLSRQQAGEAGP